MADSTTSPQRASTESSQTSKAPIGTSFCRAPMPCDPLQRAITRIAREPAKSSLASAEAGAAAYQLTIAMPESTVVTVQTREPHRWPRTKSCMRWSRMRPTKPRVCASEQSRNATPKAVSANGQASVSQMLRARLSAMKRMWAGKAKRKSCAAKADSCDESAKVPVNGRIARLVAAAWRSGSRSLRGASRARSDGVCTSISRTAICTSITQQRSAAARPSLSVACVTGGFSMRVTWLQCQQPKQEMGSKYRLHPRFALSSGARAQVHPVALEASNRVGVASGVCCHTHHLSMLCSHRNSALSRSRPREAASMPWLGSVGGGGTMRSAGRQRISASHGAAGSSLCTSVLSAASSDGCSWCACT
eukprot:scaffold34862_cov61-Phaeocystis_antarctica.AAC.6